MPYLLDTDWIIDYLNNAPLTVERVLSIGMSDLRTSAASVGELYYGVSGRHYSAAGEQVLSRLLDQIEVLPIDRETGRLFGQERRRLDELGQPLDPLDIMIAATALQHDLTLLTNNVRHFERIDGLRIETV